MLRNPEIFPDFEMETEFFPVFIRSGIPLYGTNFWSIPFSEWTFFPP